MAITAVSKTAFLSSNLSIPATIQFDILVKKYIRLFRLQDQYLHIVAILITSLFLDLKDIKILYWIITATCFSVATFAINELIDRKDVDKYSWNKLHVGSSVTLIKI